MCRFPPSLIAVLLTLALPLAALAAKPAVSPAVVDELSRRPDAPLLIDVRSPEEFAAGHVPGAVNIPYDQVSGRWARWKAEDRPAVVPAAAVTAE